MSQEVLCVSRMNGPTRKLVHDRLCKEDGPYCRCCGALSWERQLIVDHKDNNNSNNSRENLQLLCRKCNYLKNPRKPPLDECVSSNEPPANTSIKINRNKEPLFRNFVKMELNDNGSRRLKALTIEGAEYAEISPVTAKRYMEKILSNEGFCEIMSGFVRYRDDYPLLFHKKKSD